MRRDYEKVIIYIGFLGRRRMESEGVVKVRNKGVVGRRIRGGLMEERKEIGWRGVGCMIDGFVSG
jgi:hypothetical protein